MGLSELCIRRPVMTVLLMLSLVVLGIAGFRQLPVAALPRIDFPTIQVSASLPGASPDSMASSVAEPLEQQFSTIPGVTSMTSTSMQGSTTIVLQFDLNRDIDAASLDVQSALSIAERRLPPQMTTPPSFRKVNPADQPVLLLALASSTMPLTDVDEYAETVLVPQISQILGVAQVSIFGQQKRAVRIETDPRLAASRGLSMADLATAVTAADSYVPVGGLAGQSRNLTINAPSQLIKAEDYRPLVVAWRDGKPVRLGDVAAVRDGAQNEQTASWYNDQRAVVLAIFRQPGANTVDVVDQVKAHLAAYRSALPAAISLDITNDRSVSIRNAVADVEFTLLLAALLVILVIFAFLKSLRATLIPVLALPVSLIATCAVMAVLGFSIDNMSLLAITLSTGFVVDDAIVMLENIVRHIEAGQEPFVAALEGAREIGFTILSMTVSLVAVFIPVLFMGGVVGRIFREFAVTISVAILVSGFVSLTLTPMLCARLLSAEKGDKPKSLIARVSDTVFARMESFYCRTLNLALRFQGLMLAVTVATLGLSIWLYVVVPKGFFPTEDTGYLTATIEALPEIGFAAMAAKTQATSAIVRQDKAVAYVLSTAGGGNNAANTARLFIALKPQGQRDSAEDVARRLRRETAVIPGIDAYYQAVQNIQIGGRSAKADVQYTLQSVDLDTLIGAVPDLVDRLKKRAELRDVTTDLELSNPELIVDIDRDRAAALGVNVDDIRSTLFNSFGVAQVATLYRPSNDYPVILEVAPELQNDPNVLSLISVKSANGAAIPLDQVTVTRRDSGPLSINHQAQQPSVTISFNVAPNVALGAAIDAVNQETAAAHLPSGISANFAGTAQVFVAGLAGQGFLLLVAALVIYIILGILYESYIHPLTILSGLPSAGVGALIALMLAGMDLSVIAVIGIVMLIGIVKKNGIMMIDYALTRQQAGVAAAEAIREACIRRFRPIMMTTFAAILGALPIALGFGAGSELRRPLGIAIAGGLLVSQLLTLYITPVMFLALERARMRFRPAPQSEAGASVTI
ncbi:MMPL family transporter [Nordella sp. HKS 07]|uniref:efflux RND transporter permease subunit n=1 Tax=Nordella sp. HKS 07 TaxID=2712222 RepID=UPI0013E19061|nr:efflux RND transporter permease subunit [Nordella sp. HKS 07]QIG46449.1 MMPL family transporter [Nordella sp. HKS 07]